MQFDSGGVALHGSFLLPAGRARRPMVVVSRGSEETDRTGLDPLPQFLAARGYVVLVYDKRGTGASKGSWEEQSIEDLAADFLAAVIRSQDRARGGSRARCGLRSTSQHCCR